MVVCAEQILIPWVFLWTQCRKQSCGDLLNVFLVGRSLFPPFLSFLWPGKGQEENRHGVEEGTVAVAAGAPNKGKNTTAWLKSPKQSQNPLRYVSSAPSMLRV